MREDREKNQEFLALLMRQQRRIYGFIASLVINAADADDIMQDTVSLMWDKFDSFEPDTNFAAWGIQIARYKILKHRRDKAKENCQFTDEAFIQIMERTPSVVNGMSDRITALQSCLDKLPDRDRNIVEMRYEQDISPKDIASSIGKAVDTVY
ncbi:MAG: sigma-70 family RNA polymerase sigma factor [Anaerohalosphaera sp.]|nr:sigma-70 family RNA polymerase sigma factor [Anaerohalosphaera sp.]